MAHAHKKAFRSDASHDMQDKTGAQAAIANTPLAFWSNMAEMQRRYFSTLAGEAGQPAEAAPSANVTEIRPNAMAPAATAISQNWMAAATECQREIASFMNERMTKNQAFLSSAAAVHDVQELVQLQAGWMQQAAQDYTSEIGKLTDIVKNGADEAIAVTA
ncbi:MAG: hypothetical protein JWO64_174 [Hyphomicrobiales bacterium]|jgi:hypothetical protein|nr:hypothetical protein [Hyphomicrobiales bacterium]